MPLALLRAARSDFRHHRFQCLMIALIVFTATTALTLAVDVRRLTNGPFDRLMAETNGAHLWFTAPPGVDLAPIAARDGVSAIAGPYGLAEVRLAGESALQFGDALPMQVLAQPAAPPATGRVFLRTGRWLAAPGEVVLDSTIAQYFRLEPGDTLSFAGPDGPVTLTVVGAAVQVASWQTEGDGLRHPPYVYVLPETLERLAPDRAAWGSVLGVRLTDGERSQTFAGAAVSELGGEVRVTEWRELRDVLIADTKVNVVLIGVFSAFSLLAAALVIANAIGGRVLAQYREIGLLKAIGFRPLDVVLLFIVEHLLLGVVAGGLGGVAGALLAPLVEQDLSELLETTPVSAFAPLPLLAVLGVVAAVVIVATAVPALRGARISTVQAITVGFARVHARSSRLARAATRLGLPATAAIGAKDAFARPVRAWVTIAGLALTIVTLTFSLGIETTLRDILAHPEHWGAPFDVNVVARGASAAEVEQALAARPEVASTLGRLELDGAGFTAFALEGDIAAYAASIPEGRPFSAPGEAIAGQAFLADMGASVGDEVRVTIGGATLDLRIVGRVIDTEYDGSLLLFGLDTYRAAVDPGAAPESYLVRLEPGAFVPEVMRAIGAALGGRAEVWPVDLGAEDDVLQIRAILITLNLVLLAIGVVNILSTAMLGVRERFRDIGILKAIGLTPRQVVGSILVATGGLAVVGALVGIPLGLVVTRLLYDELGRQTGIGTGIGIMPSWPTVLALIPAALVLALLGGWLPAKRAASLRVTEALRYE